MIITERIYEEELTLLGVTKFIDPKQLHDAYTQTMVECHPDKNIGNVEAAKVKAQEVLSAYVLLKQALSHDHDINAHKTGNPNVYCKVVRPEEGHTHDSMAVAIIDDIKFDDLIKNAKYSKENLIEFMSNPINHDLAIKIITSSPFLAEFLRYSIGDLALKNEAFAQAVIKTSRYHTYIISYGWQAIAEKYPEACRLMLNLPDIYSNFTGIELVKLVDTHGDNIKAIIKENKLLQTRYQAIVELTLLDKRNKTHEINNKTLLKLIEDANI